MGEWLKIGKIQFKLWCDMCDQTFANVFAYRYYKTSIFTIAQVHKYHKYLMIIYHVDIEGLKNIGMTLQH